MPPSETTKKQAISDLIVAAQQAYHLHAALIFRDDEENAEKAGELSDRLDAQIDDLIAARMEDWIETSDDVVKEIQSSSDEVKADVADIAHGVASAKKVADALGLLDQVLSLAATFVKLV
jgi:MinD superfamily P-loop ATPase